MRTVDKIKTDKTKLPEAVSYQLENVETDVEKTLGKVEFLGLTYETQERDDNGELTGVVLERRYSLMSMQQLTDFVVTIPGDVPVKEITVGTVVTLKNPTFSTYAIDRNSEGISVKAEDIVTVGNTKPAGETKGNDPDKK